MIEQILSPKNPYDYFNKELLRVKIRISLTEFLLKRYVDRYSIKNFIINKILGVSFPFSKSFFDDSYFIPTKQKLTKDNFLFFPSGLRFNSSKYIFNLKCKIRLLEKTSEICNELAQKYGDNSVWCEDRGFNTTYNERAKYVSGCFKKMKTEWRMFLS